jgi:glycosyltransferase involved in cell wall biosynthesis
MEAAKIILKERQETQFVLVGNGPLKEKLVADVKAAGMAGNFTFLGDVSDDDLVQAHQCADVFMFPSIQEGQGIALLEAQACAKPVVAFSTSGVSEAVRSGETGILVEAGDSWQLAKATLKLLANDALREKMGAAGRSFVRAELSWDVCAFRMLGVYREAINLV